MFSPQCILIKQNLKYSSSVMLSPCFTNYHLSPYQTNYHRIVPHYHLSLHDQIPISPTLRITIYHSLSLLFLTPLSSDSGPSTADGQGRTPSIQEISRLLLPVTEQSQAPAVYSTPDGAAFKEYVKRKDLLY